MAASTDLLNWLNGIEAPAKPGGQSSVGYAWMMVLRATVLCREGIDLKLTPPLVAGQLLRIGGICPRHAQAHQGHQLQRLGLDVLQQPAVDPRPRVLFGPLRRLVERKPCSQLVSGIANTKRGRRIELTN